MSGLRAAIFSAAIVIPSWANEPGCESERLTKEEILSWIREAGVKNVTLTGGEPLLRKGMEELIEAILEDPSQRVEIETNGSVDLKPYHTLKKTSVLYHGLQNTGQRHGKRDAPFQSGASGQ